MLNVIDTATSQANLDFPLAFGEGWTDCYVKMGGDNVDTYVAPWYTRQVDRCRAAGFHHIGHYWVPDANPADPDPIDTPTQQADFMVDHLHDWRKASDFLVLDNEALDGAWMFTDAGAAEFIERAKARKGIPGRQCAMYGGWYDLAAHPWPLVLATGAMFIVADYRASSQPGMNFPDIPTIPRERIIGHQYGGRAIGGVVTDTNAFVDHAFEYGGTMEDQMRQFIAANRKPADAATWDQMCGALIYRFNSWRGWLTSPVRDISSAFRASQGSTIISTDFMRAPVGAFHFFDIAGPANGHVMQDARGGGLVCLSSGYALSESLGSAIGFQSVPGYVAAKGARYIGWSKDYAGGTISTAGLAGGGSTPIEEDEMTPDQIAALDQARNNAILANENAAEARRMLGVLLGYNPPANDIENKSVDAIRAGGESRRMLGVLLGWNAPATDGERSALEALRAVPDLDEAAIAEALAPHLPDGIDPAALASSVTAGVVGAFKAQWAK